MGDGKGAERRWQEEEKEKLRGGITGSSSLRKRKWISIPIAGIFQHAFGLDFTIGLRCSRHEGSVPCRAGPEGGPGFHKAAAFGRAADEKQAAGEGYSLEANEVCTH